jgi:pimeloyl-ACP methyl ester carboxylesterase
LAYVSNPQDGVQIHYTVKGNGPPLVILHGSGGSTRFWHDLGYVDALEEHAQLILMDARGHGRSEKPVTESAYAMKRFVGDIVAVLDELELPAAHYFGYSMGGRVAFGLGKYAPSRFLSMVIGGGSHKTQTRWFDRLIFPGAVETIARHGMAAFVAEWERRLGAPLPPAIRQTYLSNDAAAIAAYLRASDREPSFDDSLSNMNMPVLLFAGSADPERLAPSQIAAHRLKDGRLLVIPDADHLTTLARRDLIIPAVIDHLARSLITAERNGSETQAA